jgi:cytochrome c oxidase cbb3-type subunit 3/ubiquinol-cytochrome c reductase cytochrome c subunit
MLSPFATTLRTFSLLSSLALAAACSRHTGAAGGPSAATSTAHAAPSTPASAGNPLAHGAELYTRYCALCHGKELTGYAADNAPSLVSPTFLDSATDYFIAQAVVNGRPGTAMGAYGKGRNGPLEDNDVRELVAFIRSHGGPAKPVPGSNLHGNPVHGTLVYHDECEKCHGSERQRGTALSLFNRALLATATPDFLRYAVVNGRPPTPMPSFEKTLAAQDIEDVVAFLMSKQQAPMPHVAQEVPKDLPVVLNPKGKPPKFTLRDERFVSADQVKQALAEHRRLVIVDARSPADWIAFHIPGAISVPYYQSKELERIPNDGTWVIAYCACPHHASGAIVDALRERKYPHTAVLDEGILVWKSRAYPLAGADTATPTPAPAPPPPPAPVVSAAASTKPAPSAAPRPQTHP